MLAAPLAAVNARQIYLPWLIVLGLMNLAALKVCFAFIHFITLMQKQDQDLATPAQVDPDNDAVKLMTIHKSKGLEFPVVFVLQTNKHFNRRDQSGPAILTKNGIGIKWLDPQTRVEYQLPQYQAAKAARQNQTLAEEMRLLYVALTRASNASMLSAQP